ncbi:MAG: LysR family transcriptional regulator [Casimicrobiaceae bacterium]
MKLTLPQLEALFWVARLGSVRAAATRLSVTQPALSLRIKDLETALGGKLLNRTSYRATLTALGLEVAQQAGRMLEIAERINHRVTPTSDMRGLIRMGSTDTFAARYLPSLLIDIEKNYPQAQIEVVVEFSVSLNAKLLRGELDVAVLTPPNLSPLLEFEKLMDLPHCWVGTHQRLGKIRTATPEALVNMPIITHPPPSLLFETIHSWFASANLTPARVNTCSSLFITKSLTCEGIGISLLPVEIINTEVRTGTLRKLSARPSIPSNTLYVSYRRDTPQRNLRVFVQRVRASMNTPLHGAGTAVEVHKKN